MEEKKSEPQITLKNISFLTKGQIDGHIEKMTRDMKFFSIFHIVYGVLVSLTIVGAIIGIPMIIYHIKLNESASSFRRFAESDDFFHLNKAFENQRKFFFFYKVLLIIGLVIILLYFIVIGYLVYLGMMSVPSDFV